jgi:hypothetical protein
MSRTALRRSAGAALVVATLTLPVRATLQDPTLDEVLDRMGRYVAAYGEKASLIVAVEKYTQTVTSEEGQSYRPRTLVAEFAVVKTNRGTGWTGYRDVVEVNGEKIGDRRDRLLRLLTETSGDPAEVARIANESARYNIGPITRNFNVPTTTLSFFQPANLARFKFTQAGTRKLDGTSVWQLDFVETQRPTLIMTRAGKDVPIEGSLWVVPEDGTVVRTRVRMRGFADGMRAAEVKAPRMTPPPAQPAPPAPPPPPAKGSSSGGTSGTSTSSPPAGVASTASNPPPSRFGSPLDDSSVPRTLESSADIEVTYKRNDASGMWLAVKMSELYEGPIPRGTAPAILARATTIATYTDFKQFGTGVTLNIPK